MRRARPVRVALAVAVLYGLVWGIASIPPSPGDRGAGPRWFPRAGSKGAAEREPTSWDLSDLPRWLFGSTRKEPLPGESLLPESLRALAAKLLQPRTREWKYIVVHHSATREGNAAVFDKMHREVRGWDGLGYHFVIGNGRGSGAGEVEVGARWLEQKHGAHAGSNEYNRHGVGICVVGDYETELFSEEAYRSLRDLAIWLSRAYDIPPAHILPHELVRPEGTACPGRNFPLARLREDVRAARK